MSKQYAPDFGKLSLWTNEGKGSAVATGVFNTVDEEGNVTGTYRVFLHENNNKKGDASPDFFGFVKFIEEQQEEEPKQKKKTLGSRKAF